MNHLPAKTSTSPQAGTETAKRLVILAKMLTSFRDRPPNPEVVAREYAETTADLPFDALNDACQRFKTGRVDGHNMAFAPSTAQLCNLASQIAARTARIHAPFRLPPPVMKTTPGLGEKLAELLMDLRASAAESRDKDRATVTADKEAAKRRSHEQWARSVLADGGDPNAEGIPVSPALERLVREMEAG